MYKLGVYLCVLSLVFRLCFGEQLILDEGADCSLYGIPGSCTRVRNCAPAIESLKRRRSPGFERCGFMGLDEMVCCPSVTVKKPVDNDPYTSDEEENSSSSSKESRFTKPKYERACDEISNKVRVPITFHIIGGDDASEGEFPHMAALGYDNDENDGLTWKCGGSVISKRFILTAAHCLASKDGKLPKIARLGVILLNDSNPHDYTIKNCTLHPKYNATSNHNDIALLEVSTDIEFSDKIFPACLYFKDDDPLGLIVTGWGKTDNDSGDNRSNILQKAILVATPSNECNEIYVKRTYGLKHIERSQICAIASGIDSCMGDSGGPLQIENRNGTFSIVGIVSYGIHCATSSPGVYTRVSQYLEWIENIVWP